VNLNDGECEMVTNLYGETILGLDDVCEIVNQRAMRNGIFDLNHSLDSSKQGFWLNPKPHTSLHKLPGFYSIFKDNVLEYIGMSTCDIGNRLSRFVKEVNLKSRHDEGYAAGEKWRAWHGLGNLKGCKIMFSEYYSHEMLENFYTYERIENRLIQIHKPRMNMSV
jgi:hypothetical protein